MARTEIGDILALKNAIPYVTPKTRARTGDALALIQRIWYFVVAPH